MLEKILRFSVDRRGLVILAVLAAAAFGGWSLVHLPIDAVPDITNRQIQVNATAPSLSPTEVEKLVTFPLETAFAGIPGLEHTRSFSRNGFAQVTAVFDDDVDIYFARQQVFERLATAGQSLPPEVETVMGPISSGLGEIYMWTLEYEHPRGEGAAVHDGRPGWQADGAYLTPEGERLKTEVELAGYLRTVEDWIVRPQMKGTPGVAEIDVIGGFVKQYTVEPDPASLRAYGLTFQNLADALLRNNTSAGPGFIEHNGESYIVRAPGRLASLQDLENVVVAERGGVPILLSAVATIRIGGEARTGAATENGEEVVLGTAFMLLGENSRTVAAAVDERLRQVGPSLPPDIMTKTVLNRTHLVDAAIGTIAKNLSEGALLVIVVLFLMLGNFRAAIITSLAIPLSMLLTAIAMVETKTSGNLMSLGAIDFGLIVDGAIIIVENCLRRLAERQQELGRALTTPERLEVVFAASKQVRTATAFGEAIIITVYLPILSLSGVEGRMFEPMALTVIFALVAAFVLSLTFVPAMVAVFVRGPVREGETRFMRWTKHRYGQALDAALRHRGTVVAAAGLLFGASLPLFFALGQEFAPTLSELDIMVRPSQIPSTSLSESTRMQQDAERAIKRLPEVAFVFSRTGTAEMATDPMPPYSADTFVILKPRSEWPDSSETKRHVEGRIEAIMNRLPGGVFELSQPLEERFNELLAGVRGDVAVKLFGEDFDVMLPFARKLAKVLADTPGATATRVEQIVGAPVLGIDVDRNALGRYGLAVQDVHDTISAAIGGQHAGQLFQGDRRFDIVVRLPEAYRADPLALGDMPIALSHQDKAEVAVALGADDIKRFVPNYVPLSAVANINLTEGPNQVSRENGKRRIVVQTNVRDRDIGSFVEDAQARIADEVVLPAGMWLSWGGQYENLVKARQRLAVVIPFCFGVILLLLYSTFSRLKPAAIVFTGVPLGLAGGIFALWLRGMPFSISAAVGFIALSGVAVLNGLVLVTFINELREEGAPLDDAIVRGAVTRLRPVLMTALVASLGFLPMALATGTGAEVQRPLATVVIGGLFSSTALTLFVLPALYALFFGSERRAESSPPLKSEAGD